MSEQTIDLGRLRMNTALFLKDVSYVELAGGAIRVMVNDVPVKDVGYYEKRQFFQDAAKLGISLRLVESDFEQQMKEIPF